MSCSVLAGCGDKRVVAPVKPPAERLVCEAAGTRPVIQPEYQIDWLTVSQAPTVPVAVQRAKAEVGKLMASVRTREGIITGYILSIEGKLFVCSDNAAWVRDFFGRLPDSP